MFNFHRIALLLIILALTMFDNVTWGQRNNEIYNLEAKWERTEANYKRDLEASKEKLRDLENKLREARQEERQLVAKGYTEQSSDFSLVQNPLVEVRKWIGILEVGHLLVINLQQNLHHIITAAYDLSHHGQTTIEVLYNHFVE